MNKEFIKLISNNYDDKYLEYLKELKEKSVAKKMIEILKEDDLTKRLNKWNDFEVKLTEVKDLNILCNPYYIGYGNPNSEILFLGKEKAFSITNNPDLFFHESINNNKQWEYLIENRDLNDLKFSPLYPQQYFERIIPHYKIKKNHTWGVYCELVNAITTKSDITTSSEILENNFFHHCFTTEVNHIPSKYSSHIKSSALRHELLQDAFFKSFKYVIIGAIGSIDPTQIKSIFDIYNESEVIEISEKDSKRKRFIEVFKTDSQKIILCNQLSGAACWTSDEKSKLIAEIKSTN
ncbi:MAG: hypothetical protein K2Y30_01310 [Flavobacteriaceae bacterium]|nr:hypothetical protein [Flavobacteriaceae bacterium]